MISASQNWLLSFKDILRDVKALRHTWNFMDSQIVAVLTKIAEDPKPFGMEIFKIVWPTKSNRSEIVWPTI